MRRSWHAAELALASAAASISLEHSTQSSEAAALPPGSVEREQLTGENGSLGLFATFEIGRDLRRRGSKPRRLPRLLEAITNRIDPRRRFERELFVGAWSVESHFTALLQLVLPEQSNAAHLALDGARHAIQPGCDLFVGVAFELPQGDLPQLGFGKCIEKSPAFVGQLGGLVRCWLAAQEVRDIKVARNFGRPVPPDQIDGPRDCPGGQHPPKVIAVGQLQRPRRVAKPSVHAVE